ALPISEHSLADLTAVIESNVIPALEGIDGLSEVQIAGQQIQEVLIDFDDDKLLEYGLDEETISQLIQASDITFPLGLTDFGGDVKNLIVDGNIATIDDLKSLEIHAMPQAPEGPMPGKAGLEQRPEAMAEAAGLEGLPDGMPDGASLEDLPDGMPDGASLENLPDEIPDGDAEIPEVPMEMPTVQLSELASIEVVSQAESISRTNG